MRYLIVFFSFLIASVAFAQIADSAKREVKLQGAINFRDIGGYATKDGKHVRWGMLYRSAAINRLTEQDVSLLDNLAISRIVDFRGPYEVANAPDKMPAHAVRISLPAGSETIGDSATMRKMMQAAMKNDSGLVAFYQNTSPFMARYKPMFQQLLTLSPDSALLFHCSAGKDRTGIAAALILYALGVNEQTILEDYEATNHYRQRENERAIPMMVKAYGMSEAAAKDMMAAKAIYLNATFTAIRNKYGSVENFLKKEMDLDEIKMQVLRAKYLE